MGEVTVNTYENHSTVNETQKLELEQETFNIIEYFGKYLSEQYEILEKTLSYLDIDDLINASHVSNSWRKATECLLKKRIKEARLRWHIHNKSTTPPNHCFKSKINFQSQFILGIQSRKCIPKDIVLRELLKRDSYICSSANGEMKRGRNIPGLLDSNMLLVQSYGIEVPYYEKNELKFFGNSQAAIFFPKWDGFQIFTIPMHKNEFEFPLPSLKGILMFSPDGDLEALENALMNIEEDLAGRVAVGGGVFNNIKTFSQDQNKFTKNDVLISACFCGENVSCHSEVLRSSGQTEDFLIKMKNTIGPFDSKKQQRIAILVRCVGRPNSKHEKKLFVKHFPDVPAFILLSEGECGYDCCECFEDAPLTKKRRCHVLRTFCYSVVYFFITVNLCS